jgi:hypothetical protein
MVLNKQEKVMVIPPTPKREHNILNLSDTMKILDLLKGGMSLSEVWVALWEKRMKHPQHSSEFSAY